MIRQLLILLLLTSCGCGADSLPHPINPPPHEQDAIEAIAHYYNSQDAPIDIESEEFDTQWYSNECLLDFKLDTEHWTIKPACVHGLAIGCHLQIALPPGGGVSLLMRSSLAHEMYHCQGWQENGDLDLNHTRAGWKTLVPNARFMIAGL